MKIPYFCCIGAELKRYEKDFDFMNQVYFYKIPAEDTIEEVLAQDYFQPVSGTVLQDDILYIYEPTAQVLYTCRFNKQNGHITAEQMVNNVPVLTPNRVLISDENGRIAAGDVTLEYLKNKVNLDGTSIMTGPLKFRAGSFSGAIAGGLGDGVSIYKIKADGSIDSEVASLTKTNGFTPGTTNAQNIGSPTLKWKDAHVARIITGIINNGYDIAVPVTNSADTLALKSEVDNAANSGDQLYTTGVWYAKMYSASTVPTGAEYDGKNYADFSQTDSGGNPVIKIYTGANGAWTLTETITPPVDYNGYMTITSKIWDIAEQAGQQGGKVLWSHNQKTFTPYPQIISFENAALTGIPTAPLPTSSSPNNQIATKEYVDNASGYHPGLFAHEWDDHIRYDVQWLRTDTFSWQNAAVYQAAYQHLADDIDGKTLQSETISGTTIQFYLADDGHKICPADQESNVMAIYNATGVAWYYIIDTTNQRFKLPRQAQKKNYHGQIIERRADGVRWAEIYSDGWVRQGGNTDNTNFLVTMANTDYSALLSPRRMYAGERTVGIQVSSKSTTSIGIDAGWEGAGSRDWTVEGWSTITSKEVLLESQKHLYFYVGQFTQTALENTAGVTTEVLNNKVDKGHEVIEFQAPTAANNYTWYRKYADGWVEQGGFVAATTSSIASKAVSLPITMANSNYQVSKTTHMGADTTDSSAWGWWSDKISSSSANTTTTVYLSVASTSFCIGVYWEVKGMAAN